MRLPIKSRYNCVGYFKSWPFHGSPSPSEVCCTYHVLLRIKVHYQHSQRLSTISNRNFNLLDSFLQWLAILPQTQTLPFLPPSSLSYSTISNSSLTIQNLQLAVVLLDGHNLQLQVHTQWQFLDCNARSGWLVLREVLSVDSIELSELGLHVGQKDVCLDNVLQRRVRGLQDGGNILDHLLGLLGDGWVLAQWLVVWGVRNLARDVDETWS